MIIVWKRLGELKKTIVEEIPVKNGMNDKTDWFLSGLVETKEIDPGRIISSK